MTTTSQASKSVVAVMRGPVLWVTLSRPEAMNALSHDVLDGIEAALQLSLDEQARCVVITGQGRAFCAGADLKFVNSALEDPAALADFLARASGVFSAVERHPLPVIAAINGTTVAGGLELALACDFIVAVESAAIADGHATFGLFPGAGGAVRLPRRIGASRAKLLLFTGRSRPARDLEAWGLVDVVAPDDGLDGAVQELCAELTARSPAGLRRMKQVVHDQDTLPVDRGLRMEFDACVAHLRTADVAEGLTAFAERRAPVFPGC